MVDLIAILIPVLALMIPIVAIWTKHERQMAELKLRDSGDAEAASAAQVRDLENRVRVLERIVTDKSASLAAEIEDLRKQHAD